jgi:hypothetical protein
MDLLRKNVFYSDGLKRSIYFYMPSKIIGGYENFFINLANKFISVGFQVYYIDYENGFVKSNNLLNSRVDIISDTSLGFHEIKQHSTLITPITLCKDLYDTYHSRFEKFIFLFGHPRSVEFFAGINKMSIEQAATYLFKIKHNIYYLDNICYKSGLKYFYNELNYFPLFFQHQNETKPINEVTQSVLNFGWLGRLDSDKIFSLINVLDCLVEYEKTNVKINFYVIGSGDSRHQINVPYYLRENINIIFKDTLINELKMNFIRENIDIMFCMGLSSIETASLGLPTVIVPLSLNKYFDKKCFQFLFDMEGYNIGYYLSNLPNNKPYKTFNEIVNEVKTNKLFLGKKCFEHIQKYHSFDNFCKTFVNYLN